MHRVDAHPATRAVGGGRGPWHEPAGAPWHPASTWPLEGSRDPQVGPAEPLRAIAHEMAQPVVHGGDLLGGIEDVGDVAAGLRDGVRMTAPPPRHPSCRTTRAHRAVRRRRRRLRPAQSAVGRRQRHQHRAPIAVGRDRVQVPGYDDPLGETELGRATMLSPSRRTCRWASAPAPSPPRPPAHPPGRTRWARRPTPRPGRRRRRRGRAEPQESPRYRIRCDRHHHRARIRHRPGHLRRRCAARRLVPAAGAERHAGRRPRPGVLHRQRPGPRHAHGDNRHRHRRPVRATRRRGRCVPSPAPALPSPRAAAHHQPDGVFGLLPNVAWTADGPVAIADLPRSPTAGARTAEP